MYNKEEVCIKICNTTRITQFLKNKINYLRQAISIKTGADIIHRKWYKRICLTPFKNA